MLARAIATTHDDAITADTVSKAIQWMREGLDFADALHLESARPAGRFATFDRKLAGRAAKIVDIAIIRARSSQELIGRDVVGRGRIELPTQGFSVLCSTD